MDVDAAMGDNDATERLVAGNLESGPAAYDPERSSRPPPPPYGAGGAPGAESTAVVSGVNDLYQVERSVDVARVLCVCVCLGGREAWRINS